MDEMLRSLNDNLSLQASLYGELNDLANQKKEALIQNNLRKLDSITVREEQILQEAVRLEGERLRWAEKIGEETGKVPEGLTLAELADRYPELRQVRSRLDEVIKELQSSHETNSKLINQALKMIDFTVKLLTGPEEITYNNPKHTTSKVSRVQILDKSI